LRWRDDHLKSAESASWLILICPRKRWQKKSKDFGGLSIHVQSGNDSPLSYLWDLAVILEIHSGLIWVCRHEYSFRKTDYQPSCGTIILGLILASVCNTVSGPYALLPTPNLQIDYSNLRRSQCNKLHVPQILRELPRTTMEEQSPKMPNNR